MTRYLVWLTWKEQPIIGTRHDGHVLRYPHMIDMAAHPQVFEDRTAAEHAAHRLRTQWPHRTVHIETRTG